MLDAAQFIIVVTGGRLKTLRTAELAARVRTALFYRLDQLVQGREPAVCALVHGESPGGGVDLWAAEWAAERGVPVHAVPISPDEARGPFPNTAGFKRNTRMVDEVAAARDRGAEVIGVVAPGGNGTADCMQKLQAARIRYVGIEL